MKKTVVLICTIFAFIACEEKEPLFFEQEFLGSDENGNYEYVVPNIYAGVPISKRQTFLIENFNDNSNGWDLENSSDAYTSIENGNYVFQNKCPNSILSTIDKPIDTQRDFEIESNIKITETTYANGNGLVWGYDHTMTDFLFFCYTFSINQNLWIGFYQWASYNPWQDWLSLNVNAMGEYNKLTIRKIGNKYYFFINEQFVGTHSFESFYGNKIGFKAEKYTTINIDYLKIDYINQ